MSDLKTRKRKRQVTLDAFPKQQRDPAVLPVEIARPSFSSFLKPTPRRNGTISFPGAGRRGRRDGPGSDPGSGSGSGSERSAETPRESKKAGRARDAATGPSSGLVISLDSSDGEQNTDDDDDDDKNNIPESDTDSDIPVRRARRPSEKKQSKVSRWTVPQERPLIPPSSASQKRPRKIDDSDSSTDQDIPSPAQKTARKRTRIVDSSDEDEVTSTARTPLRSSQRPPRPPPPPLPPQQVESDQESDDPLALELLRKRRLARKNTSQYSSDPDSSPARRPAGSSKRQTRQALLARLKAHRTADGNSSFDAFANPDDDDGGEGQGGHGDEAGTSDWDSDEVDLAPGTRHFLTKEDDPAKPGRRRRPAEILHDPNAEDESFIVSDSEALLGQPDGPASAIPIQFTSLASARASELFKYVISWMVRRHLFFLPAELDLDDWKNLDDNDLARCPMDEVSELAFRKLDDEVKGMAGSKFISSVWRPEFVQTLLARPEVIVLKGHDSTDLGTELELDYCEACGRSNKPAPYKLVLRGKPYHLKTLDTVETVRHIRRIKDGRKPKRYATETDGAGNELVPEDHVFSLGRFCLFNAEMAHRLTHWRYQLSESVSARLESSGYPPGHGNTALGGDDDDDDDGDGGENEPEELIGRVVDELEEQGGMRMLYREWKDLVDNARTASTDSLGGRWGGGR